MIEVNLTPDLISREQLIGKIQKDMDQTVLVYALLVCATLIASIGLNYNSTTTIIGAMLISPLLNGVNGIGFGLGLSHFNLVRKGLLVFTIQVIIILVISFLFFYLTPIKDSTPEILTQTSATIWDILIALIGSSALDFASMCDRVWGIYQRLCDCLGFGTAFFHKYIFDWVIPLSHHPVAAI